VPIDPSSWRALKPLELLEKLAALIPRPYVNLIVYHGVLAPNAKWRGEVVVFGPARVESEPSASSQRKVAACYNFPMLSEPEPTPSWTRSSRAVRG
jgi:hypothetical protein